ncbi:MAG: hypothetical protein E6J56_22435 [Deltaproteobacteria bacterium]|nr:MAG: hypothetical protein E6J56_22435 [Deltaproteobacteria bacterium]
MIPEVRARRNDIDWLRIGATFLLFVFHPARPFDHQGWHVKSAVQSDAFDLLVWFIHQFHMPLFFALAGWSLERSLRFRSVADIRRERRRRLLIPFLAGVALLSPPQAYVEAVTQRGYTGTVTAFLGCFFTSLRCFSWHHLWFLIYLFTFTMVYLPLVARFPRSTRRTALAPGVVLAAMVPFALVQVGLRARWPGEQNLFDDWANFIWYSLFFLGGFVVSRVPSLEDTIQRGRRTWMAGFWIAAVAMLPILVRHRAEMFVPGAPYAAYWSLSAAAGVLGVASALAWGRRLEGVDGPRFRYLRESLLPVYILHQPVIVLLAYWLVHSPLPIGVEYLVLATLSLATTMALYHFVIRRVAILRFLFGMPPGTPAIAWGGDPRAETSPVA